MKTPAFIYVIKEIYGFRCMYIFNYFSILIEEIFGFKHTVKNKVAHHDNMSVR